MQPRSLCRRSCSASTFTAPKRRLSVRFVQDASSNAIVASLNGPTSGFDLHDSDPSARAARGHERDRRLGTCRRRNRGRSSRRAAGRDERSGRTPTRFARSRLGGVGAPDLATSGPGRTRLEPRARLRRGCRRSSAGRARRGHHKPDDIARRKPAARGRGRRGPAGAAAGRRHARRRLWTRPTRAAAPRPGGT